MGFLDNFFRKIFGTRQSNGNNIKKQNYIKPAELRLDFYYNSKYENRRDNDLALLYKCIDECQTLFEKDKIKRYVIGFLKEPGNLNMFFNNYLDIYAYPVGYNNEYYSYCQKIKRIKQNCNEFYTIRKGFNYFLECYIDGDIIDTDEEKSFEDFKYEQYDGDEELVPYELDSINNLYNILIDQNEIDGSISKQGFLLFINEMFYVYLKNLYKEVYLEKYGILKEEIQLNSLYYELTKLGCDNNTMILIMVMKELFANGNDNFTCDIYKYVKDKVSNYEYVDRLLNRYTEDGDMS